MTLDDLLAQFCGRRVPWWRRLFRRRSRVEG